MKDWNSQIGRSRKAKLRNRHSEVSVVPWGKTSNMKFSLGTGSSARPCNDTSGHQDNAEEDNAGAHSLDCLLRQGLGEEARQQQQESKCKIRVLQSNGSTGCCPHHSQMRNTISPRGRPSANLTQEFSNLNHNSQSCVHQKTSTKIFKPHETRLFLLFCFGFVF